MMTVKCDNCDKEVEAALVPKETFKTPAACLWTQPKDWRFVYNDVYIQNACSDECAQAIREQLDEALAENQKRKGIITPP